MGGRAGPGGADRPRWWEVYVCMGGGSGAGLVGDGAAQAASWGGKEGGLGACLIIPVPVGQAVVVMAMVVVMAVCSRGDDDDGAAAAVTGGGAAADGAAVLLML